MKPNIKPIPLDELEKLYPIDLEEYAAAADEDPDEISLSLANLEVE